jgi:hypothetical protein
MMEATDVIAIVGATVVALLAGALVVVLVSLARTMREMRAVVGALRDETVELLDAAYDAVHEAAKEVDRDDRLVVTAERIDGVVDSAYRKFSAPMVKAMAFGTGVSRAANRMREGEPPSARRRRRRSA